MTKNHEKNCNHGVASANVNGNATVNADPVANISITQFSSHPTLPESLSPCANVRRSCSSLMKDKPFNSSSDGNDNATSTRSVTIDPIAIDNLANKITQSILEKYPKNTTKINEDNAKRQKQACTSTAAAVDKCIDSLDFASWDADGWHYTGSNYSRPHLPKEVEERQRFERVSLYVMIMDCINFCFWPVEDDNEKGVDSGDNETNLLEYEHLAIALKKLAEADDVLPSPLPSREMDTVVKNSNETLKYVHILCRDGLGFGY